MDRDEKRPDNDPQERPEAPPDIAMKTEPTEGQAPAEPETEAPGDQPREEPGRYLRTAAISAAVLLFALAFFTAGYWMSDLRDSDPKGSVTRPSASDDPAWGPEEAAVTIEEPADFNARTAPSSPR